MRTQNRLASENRPRAFFRHDDILRENGVAHFHFLRRRLARRDMRDARRACQLFQPAHAIARLRMARQTAHHQKREQAAYSSFHLRLLLLCPFQIITARATRQSKFDLPEK